MRWMYWLMGVVILSVMGGVALAASALDGTKWRVEMTREGGVIPSFIDRVHFDDGKFTSAIFERKGFRSSLYTLTEDPGGPIIWEVKQKSETKGDVSWHGELKGDAMGGTAVWKQPDGTVISYTLTGRPGIDEPPEPEQKSEAAEPLSEGVLSPSP